MVISTNAMNESDEQQEVRSGLGKHPHPSTTSNKSSRHASHKGGRYAVPTHRGHHHHPGGSRGITMAGHHLPPQMDPTLSAEEQLLLADNEYLTLRPELRGNIPKSYLSQEQQQQQQLQSQHRRLVQTAAGFRVAPAYPQQLHPFDEGMMDTGSRLQGLSAVRPGQLAAAAPGLQMVYPTIVGGEALYAPSPYAVAPPTTIAIDAETGRPVRVVNPAYSEHVAMRARPQLQSSAYMGDQGYLTRQPEYAHLGPQAGIVHQRQALMSGGGAPGGAPVLFDRASAAAASSSLPLYITDPNAPLTDLGRPASPPLVHDAYSFSNNSNIVSGSNSMDDSARRRFAAAAAAARREEELASYYGGGGAAAAAGSSIPGIRLGVPHDGRALHISQTVHSHSYSLPLPPSKPGEFPAVLYTEADEEKLTSYQCLLRKQLELFEANMDDVRCSTRQGRTAPIKLGQVGLRCRHCAGVHLASRTKGAAYYSQTIEGIYQVRFRSIPRDGERGTGDDGPSCSFRL
mmetsp:Transcript_12212/g.22734  ORF Transcript_12212/g.22734 Transcript_12212/m.22734 type:complete len:514 (+) Transcript_12212:465-2006(+)